MSTLSCNLYNLDSFHTCDFGFAEEHTSYQKSHFQWQFVTGIMFNLHPMITFPHPTTLLLKLLLNAKLFWNDNSVPEAKDHILIIQFCPFFSLPIEIPVGFPSWVYFIFSPTAQVLYLNFLSLDIDIIFPYLKNMTLKKSFKPRHAKSKNTNYLRWMDFKIFLHDSS